MNIRTRRVAVYGLLIALAFVFGYIERLLPIYLGAPDQPCPDPSFRLCLWGNVLHSVQPGWSGPKPACYVDLPPFFSF